MYRFETLVVTKGKEAATHTINLEAGRCHYAFEYRSEFPTKSASLPVSESRERITDKTIAPQQKFLANRWTDRQKLFHTFLSALMSAHTRSIAPNLFRDSEGNVWKLGV